ncbi:Alternative cytochrome c oxidase subunit 2 [Halioglobus japonicus]|nr:Alternative cytochrome c oxidase subunit 2 [Halioglobus japonicus]
MKIVVALVLLVVISLLFHWLSPWWMTPLASNWGMIDATIDLTLYITGFVFVAVNLFMAWSIFRYRHDPERRSHYEPENKKLETWLIVITTVGVVAMLAPGLIVWADFVDVPEGADEVEVVGAQWQWSYRFPGADGVLGEVDSRFVSPENPFGMSSNDPAGSDDILVDSNELHLPIDRPVKLLLRSKDVLHNFAVPQFRVKMDLVPGMVTYAWLTPTVAGKYDILCMELCGIAHYTMRGSVVVDEQPDFERWLAQQPTWRELQAIPPGDPIAGQASYATCAACHGQQAEGNLAMNAPSLAILPDWYIARQIEHFKHGIRGANEADEYGRQMAPMANMLPDAAAIRNVNAYIATLEPVAATATLHGDPQRGASFYTTCGACHGARAQGNSALQAPRLAGQDDWYLKRQLQNFRLGVRGAHDGDTYGHQMVLMARSLQNEQSINDLLAYLNTL